MYKRQEEGYANITKLPQGLYLVVQTEASHGYEAIKPFLVSIPMPDGDNWIYDVDATPKVGATIPETPDTPDTPDCLLYTSPALILKL